MIHTSIKELTTRALEQHFSANPAEAESLLAQPA